NSLCKRDTNVVNFYGNAIGPSAVRRTARRTQKHDSILLRPFPAHRRHPQSPKRPPRGTKSSATTRTAYRTGCTDSVPLSAGLRFIRRINYAAALDGLYHVDILDFLLSYLHRITVEYHEIGDFTGCYRPPVMFLSVLPGSVYRDHPQGLHGFH